MDKTVIYQHLYHNSTNPFTRELLTIESLLEFNETPESQLQVQEFIDNYTQWKDSHT